MHLCPQILSGAAPNNCSICILRFGPRKRIANQRRSPCTIAEHCILSFSLYSIDVIICWVVGTASTEMNGQGWRHLQLEPSCQCCEQWFAFIPWMVFLDSGQSPHNNIFHRPKTFSMRIEVRPRIRFNIERRPTSRRADRGQRTDMNDPQLPNRPWPGT
jgi:hypothetical protein